MKVINLRNVVSCLIGLVDNLIKSSIALISFLGYSRLDEKLFSDLSLGSIKNIRNLVSKKQII